MKNNFLHIGYHKTGTTWMQKFLFPQIFSENYLGKSSSAESSAYAIDQLKNSNGKFISNEWFMKQKETTKELSSYLYDTLSEFSKKGFLRKRKPDTKIIISIRNQPDVLVSRHLHGFGAFEIWDDDLSVGLFRDKEISQRLLDYYNFAETYKNFIKSFGEKNVHIIVYENLFNNTSNEIDRFLNFVEEDIDIKQRLSVEQSSRSLVNKTQSPFEDEKKILPIIYEAYEKSNSELSSLIDFDLSKYGYHK